MKNIFEGAKFGDKFLLKNNKCAILTGYNPLEYRAFLIIESNNSAKDYIEHVRLMYRLDGVCIFSDTFMYDCSILDIVSRYQEPIDESKLDELAKEYPLDISGGEVSEYIEYLIDKAFKAGYRKAMEG